MSSNENPSTSKSSPIINFGKAIVLVIIAIVAIKLLGFIMRAVFGILITVVIVLVVGLLIFGLFKGAKKL